MARPTPKAMLRKWRKDNELSQWAAAKRLGVTQSTICYLESDVDARAVGLDLALRIERMTGIPCHLWVQKGRAKSRIGPRTGTDG